MIKTMLKRVVPAIVTVLVIVGCIAPATAFAGTGVKVNATSEGIICRVVISKNEDSDVGEARDCMTDQPSPSIDFPYDFQKYFIGVEPDFFTGGRLTSIKINGEEQEIGHPLGRNVYEVEPAEIYNVEISGVQEQHYNIMWANDGAKVEGTDFDDPEILLQNGSAKVIQVFDNETDMNDITDQIDHAEEGCIDPDGKGYVDLAEGNVVIFEFTPKYGYQLTSVSANGTKLEAQDTMNQYRYVMPATNIHFQATFTKTEDVVKTATDKVSGGTVKIGTNEINAGSAVLSVNDAVLTDEEKEVFATEAGEYSVSNVFDIKLDQVFYKGSTNSDDVWSVPMGHDEDLTSFAVVALELEEGVDGNDVVIIHEKEDGTFEIIETIYDEKTHTVLFSTKSFSNYAIASKTISEPKKNESQIDNPRTGDNAMNWVIIFIISVCAIAGIIIYRKDRIYK